MRVSVAVIWRVPTVSGRGREKPCAARAMRRASARRSVVVMPFTVSTASDITAFAE